MTADQSSGRSPGIPISFALVPTPQCWQHVTYLHDPVGITQGILADIPATAPLEQAQAELQRLAEAAHGRKLHVQWESPNENGWCVAQVNDAGPLLGNQQDAQQSKR
ncbi:hypothetical protein [Nocardia yamanashiensis]|uniref:hypothetical protein n=1 Tax=Nocardia yamanashiensis TaxID=209247 RepID=UPI000833BB8C|nr:hypothetical protein [Nocardia yamanashiensis]